MDAVVYSDGARQKEDGPVGWGCQVIMEQGRYERSGVLISSSVLLAELQGAMAGVELALEHGATSVVVYTDCTPVIDLAQGRARGALKDPAIAERFAQLQGWNALIELRWVWVRSHLRHGSGGNNRADYLARQAIKHF
ncbi:MAG: reverse transcriptase-like protein [Chloroflexi bacterium]|nr:reverse transcriptase-like protein [Chloroflexota bacterium]